MTAAILYNLVFVVGRAVFWELSNAAPVFWYTLDYTADSIYILDTILHAHEGKTAFFFNRIIFHILVDTLYYYFSGNLWIKKMATFSKVHVLVPSDSTRQ